MQSRQSHAGIQADWTLFELAHGLRAASQQNHNHNHIQVSQTGHYKTLSVGQSQGGRKLHMKLCRRLEGICSEARVKRLSFQSVYVHGPADAGVCLETDTCGRFLFIYLFFADSF